MKKAVWAAGLLLGFAMSAFAPGSAFARQKQPDLGDQTEQLKDFPRDFFASSDELFEKQKKMVGKPMPPLSPKDWHPDSASSMELRRKIGVIFLFNAHDETCIRDLIELQKIQTRYKDKSVAVLAIAIGDGQEDAIKVAESNNIAFGIAQDDSNHTNKDWQVELIPTITLIDIDGKVRAMGLKMDHLEQALAQMLVEGGVLNPDYKIPPPGAEPTPTPAPSGAAKPAPAKKPANDGPLVNGIPRSWLRGTDEQRQRLKDIDGRRAPGIHGDNFINSGVVGLDQFNNKVILLHFWNAANGVSIAAIAHTKQLAETYKDKDLVVIGLCSPRGSANMEKIIAARKIDFSCALDTGDVSAQRYFVEGSGDSFYLIDRHGNLRIADCERDHLEDAIKMLTAEPALKGPKSPRKGGPH